MKNQPSHVTHATRAEGVTRNFRGLQGYKWLPWLPVLLLWWGSEAGFLEGAWWMWAFLGALVLAAVGSGLVGRWYARHYGEVRSGSERRAPLLALVAILVVTLLYGLATGGSPLAPSFQPVAWLAFLLGVGLAAAGWRLRPVTAHAWWFGVALAVVALTPIGWLPLFDGRHPFNADGALLGIIGAFMLFVGIGSHRTLDRTLKQPGEADEPRETDAE